ncbi:endo-1,4-beta-xylanase [Draconibacterium sp. IB214405]|uniref:endo-1,4-beta-xylanase n=1 Tax=Draconibacterium sp. IB214405 TaxID=3097352 RepID=UPI002A119ECB|nr:endo-1,4-beta-xylanase [Draconibacterium sp. IB214405]MDX8339601.1 endo-1,4-beta-xylanase [Draconibacterium sp. IB214405]
MMTISYKNILFIFSLLLFVACGESSDEFIPEEEEEEEETRPTNIAEYNASDEGLKDYYLPEEYFQIGAAIEPSAITNSYDVKLLKRHINSLTAENVMKWSTLQATEGNFNYTQADKIVAFAQANGMKVRGHTLCWHNQVPSWVFRDGSQEASKELVLERLRTHITNVVTHFKGKVYVWDVVNEAIDDGGSQYKNTDWYRICGEDYIFEAFKAARQADPDAKLFYNDYSATSPNKRDKIYTLLSKLHTQNLVDGIGMQGHWNIDAPSSNNITSAFDKYAYLDLEIQITELDVSVYTSDANAESEYTSDIASQQKSAYNRYFSLFRDYKDNITSITFWGVCDNHTWLDNFPVNNRKNYPFLFDINYDPKPAYFSVIDF